MATIFRVNIQHSLTGNEHIFNIFKTEKAAKEFVEKVDTEGYWEKLTKTRTRFISPISIICMIIDIMEE